MCRNICIEINYVHVTCYVLIDVSSMSITLHHSEWFKIQKMWRVGYEPSECIKPSHWQQLSLLHYGKTSHQHINRRFIGIIWNCFHSAFETARLLNAPSNHRLYRPPNCIPEIQGRMTVEIYRVIKMSWYLARVESIFHVSFKHKLFECAEWVE